MSDERREILGGVLGAPNKQREIVGRNESMDGGDEEIIEKVGDENEDGNFKWKHWTDASSEAMRNLVEGHGVMYGGSRGHEASCMENDSCRRAYDL